jgi:hypothetical protein
MSRKNIQVNQISNPDLEFDSSTHVAADPIYGLSTWDPCVYPSLQDIKVCAVCAPAYVNDLQKFWADLKGGFDHNVFVPFPGFSTIFNLPMSDLTTIINPDRKTGDVTTRYASSVKDVPSDFDMTIVVLPYDLPIEAAQVYNEVKASSFSRTPRLKTQCVRKSTLQRLDDITPDKNDNQIRYIRSAHSIDLWNIGTAIFTKVGGTPWKLKEPMSEVGCFTGLVTNTKLIDVRRYIKDSVGVCEVVDSWGSHVVWVREALPSLKRSREDGVSVIEIEPDETRRLFQSCLDKYARTVLGSNYHDKIDVIKDRLLVFHITDIFSQNVLDEMENAITDFGFDRYQIIKLQAAAHPRIYDQDSIDNVPLRGSYWKESEDDAILYTHGRREYRRGIVKRTYSVHKRVTPIGVQVLRQNNGFTLEKTLQHILSLTGLCWYTTDIEIKMPVTIKIARRISDLWKRGVLTDFEDVRLVL